MFWFINSSLIIENEIDICVLQEIDLMKGYDVSLLSFKGYNFITEENTVKSRTGMYIKNGIKYTQNEESFTNELTYQWMTRLLFFNVNAPVYDENKHILILILNIN